MARRREWIEALDKTLAEARARYREAFWEGYGNAAFVGQPMARGVEQGVEEAESSASQGSERPTMHPHLNCPLCPAYGVVSHGELDHRELTLFLVEHGHSRNWQDVAAKLLKQFTLTKKEKSNA